MQLDLIVKRIDAAFDGRGSAPAVALQATEQLAWQQLLENDASQDYLQDLVNQQIIRAYLVNAVMLGLLPQQRLAELHRLVDTAERRAALSLQMLMNSVEDASALLGAELEALVRLDSPPEPPPQMQLVRE